jgi:hypothetical protein
MCFGYGRLDIFLAESSGPLLHGWNWNKPALDVDRCIVSVEISMAVRKLDLEMSFWGGS